MFSRSGNNWTNGANLGAFYRNANYVASDSNRNYCARISSIKHAHRAHGSVPLGKNRPIRRGLVGKPKTGEGEERCELKRYGGLYEKLLNTDNLKQAIRASSRHKRDRESVREALANQDAAAGEIARFIKAGFRPAQPSVRVIYDARRCKDRTICCPRYFPDQIVHHALMQVLIPCLMRGMSDHCMASVPGRGEHSAIRRIERWITEDRKGTKYAYQFDIRHFYENIDRDLLKERIRRLVKDERFLAVLFAVIDSYQGKGLPIGFYTSQWLANFFLQDLDHMIHERFGAAHFIRYMDDVIILGPNKRKLHRMRREIESYLASIGLSVKPNWQIYRTASRPIGFLGFKLRKGRTTLRSRTFLTMSRRMRKVGKKSRPTLHDARAVMSYLGMASHVTGDAIMQRHVYPHISVKRMKGIIRHAERKQREAASRRDRKERQDRTRHHPKELRASRAR